MKGEKRQGYLGAGIALLGPGLCCGAYLVTLAGGGAAAWAAVREWWWLTGPVLAAMVAAGWSWTRRRRSCGLPRRSPESET